MNEDIVVDTDVSEHASLLARLPRLPGARVCRECDRVISGNKNYCAAHLPEGMDNLVTRKTQ